MYAREGRLSFFFVPVKFVNRGQGIKRYAGVQTKAGMKISKVAVDGEEFELESMSLKSPSEHMILGRRFALEVQLVHRSSFNPDQRVVLSTMYNINADGSHFVGDVFAEEPLPASSALWEDARVTVTPHVAAVTRAEDVAGVFAANYARYCAEGVAGLRPVFDWERGY